MRRVLAITLAGWAGTLGAASIQIQVTEDLSTAEVVILGEVHDNPTHHLIQAAYIAELRPRAVVFEMLTPDMADAVNAIADRTAPDVGTRIGWEASGWPDYTIYQPVFAALGSTPAVGAAQPRAQVRAAFSQGAAAVFGADAARFGLDQPLPDEQLATRKALQFEAHCDAMPLDMMGGMVEAQRFRDARFSAATLAALDRFGAPVVVITGNGHARADWGMPAMIATAAPEVTVFSLGLTEDSAGDPDTRFDKIIASPPVDRPDPCAAFQK